MVNSLPCIKLLFVLLIVRWGCHLNTLSFSTFTDFPKNFIARCPNLIALEFSDFQQRFKMSAFKSISARLKIIRLTNVAMSDDTMIYFRKCPNLEVLELMKISFISSKLSYQSLMVLSKFCPKLRKLTFPGNFAGDDGLSYAQAWDLHYLDFSSSITVETSFSSVLDTAKSWPNLAYLDMSNSMTQERFKLIPGRFI